LLVPRNAGLEDAAPLGLAAGEPVAMGAEGQALVQPQRGCGTKPRVGAERLPWVNRSAGRATATRLRLRRAGRRPRGAETPLGFWLVFGRLIPRVGAVRQPWAGRYNPFGIEKRPEPEAQSRAPRGEFPKGVRFGLFTQGGAPLALGYYRAVPTGLGFGSLRSHRSHGTEVTVQVGQPSRLPVSGASQPRGAGARRPGGWKPPSRAGWEACPTWTT
jgi:hypothetical protein